MKKTLLFTVTACWLLLTSCEKRLCCVLPQYEAYIKADKNNTNWAAKAAIEKAGTDSIAITGTGTEERLLMNIKFTGEGTYILTGNQAKYFTTIGRDVITSNYNADNITTSTVEVKFYDRTEKTITGTYTLALKKLYANPTDAYPATIKFTNGMFTAYLPN